MVPSSQSGSLWEAISGCKLIYSIAAVLAIHLIQVSQRKRSLFDKACDLFTKGKKTQETGGSQAKEAELFQVIRQLQMVLEALLQYLIWSDSCGLCKLVDHDHPELSVSS